MADQHHHHHHHDGTGHTHRVTAADGVRVPAGTRIAPGAIAATAPAERVLWLDAGQGASGDMLLAALLDAGADAESVAAVLELVAPGALHLQTRRVQRGPFAARKVDVIADEVDPPARHLSDVVALLAAPGIPEWTRKTARRAFELLARAEAKVHGTSVDAVHFHEVGALDSIGDIVGVCEAFRTLGIARAFSSPVAVGAGTVSTQHGLLAVPPPAVVELARDWQVLAGGPDDVGELTTPTGMVLIRTLCESVASLPTMHLDSVGIGAGTRIRADRAGVLRVFLGRAAPRPGPEPSRGTPSEVIEVSANIDDLDPRVWPAVLDRLLDAGSVDAWLTPIIMKQGRPAHTISALVEADVVEAVVDALVSHTSTIGVRISTPWRRRVLRRIWRAVDVDGNSVRIKVSGNGPGAPIQQATAEFRDVAALADALGVPQRVALARAQSVAWDNGLHPGAEWPADEGDGHD